MTFALRLDSAHPARQSYGCADCGWWFRTASELVAHVIECRGEPSDRQD